jgi:hypothetical protein
MGRSARVESVQVFVDLRRHCQRLTDNWLAMTVRFVVRDHGIREVKDAMSRDIITGLDAAGISVASGTHDIVGLPPIRVQALNLDGRRLTPPPN